VRRKALPAPLLRIIDRAPEAPLQALDRPSQPFRSRRASHAGFSGRTDAGRRRQHPSSTAGGAQTTDPVTEFILRQPWLHLRISIIDF
jgi:hypothetical protein